MSDNMRVLKHLAQDYEVDTYRLRQLLRKQFKTNGGRWKWDLNNKEQAAQYASVQSYLTETLSPSSPATKSKASSKKKSEDATTPSSQKKDGKAATSKRKQKNSSITGNTTSIEEELKNIGVH